MDPVIRGRTGYGREPLHLRGEKKKSPGFPHLSMILKVLRNWGAFSPNPRRRKKV